MLIILFTSCLRKKISKRYKHRRLHSAIVQMSTLFNHDVNIMQHSNYVNCVTLFVILEQYMFGSLLFLFPNILTAGIQTQQIECQYESLQAARSTRVERNINAETAITVLALIRLLWLDRN